MKYVYFSFQKNCINFWSLFYSYFQIIEKVLKKFLYQLFDKFFFFPLDIRLSGQSDIRQIYRMSGRISCYLASL